MNNPVIKVENLKKCYTLGEHRVPALRGINAEINAGEFIVIFGPSGCGKTTFLSLMSGLDRPTEGTVYIRGTDIYQLPEDKLADYRRTKIGVVFQQFNLLHNLTAIDNVALPLILAGVGRREAYKRAAELLEIVNLKNRLYHHPVELSGGEQQRIGIARALASNPWILFVDEPTGNLDEAAAAEVMQVLQKINSWGRTIVLVTHNPSYLKYGHRIFFMEGGKLNQDVKNSERKLGGLKEEVKSDLKYYIAEKKVNHIRISESIRLSLIHFFSKKLRTFLTTLGVSLGVGSIVTLVSLGIGLQEITASQIASFNALVTISVSKEKNSRFDLDDETVQKIKQIPNVSLVSPMVTYPAKITIGESSSQTIINGLAPEALSFEGVKVDTGSYFDEDGAIISKALLKNFQLDNPGALIGKDITFNLITASSGDQFAGIKTTEIKTKIRGISSDDVLNSATLPLAQLQKSINFSTYSSLRVKASDRKKVEQIRTDIEKLGFSTTSVVDLINQIDNVFFITQVILGIIGGIALLVALIGIVNIMTISLLERTHEVGIMKAIGATNKDIRRIFQYEVMFFGLFGGVFGIGGAWLVGFLINSLIGYLIAISHIDTKMHLFVTPALFATEMLILTILVSLLAGVYPARRASKLSPSEALRYE